MIAPTDAELSAIVTGYEQDRARPAVGSVRPFTIVTPLGRADEAAFAAALARLGIRVEARDELPTWPRVATALYTPRADRSRMIVAFAFVRAWAEHHDEAAVWWLESHEDYERLIAAKSDLRARFPSQAVRIETPVATRDATLHRFHVPDRGRLAAENAIVAAYV
jgi:hypothetical protein